MVVGPRQGERAQGRGERLRGAPSVAGRAAAAGAREPGPGVIRGVGVHVRGQTARRERHGLASARDLQRLEVERGRYAGAEERRDLADRLRRDGRGQPLFSPGAGAAAAASSCASAQASQAAQ